MEDADHVELIVGVGDDVAKARRPAQALGERGVDDSGGGQTPKGVGVGRGRAQIESQTRRQREVNDDLDGLPEMEDDRVGFVRGWPQQLRGRWQSLRHARQVPSNRHGAFGEDVGVERTHRRKRASTSAEPVRRIGSASHENDTASSQKRSKASGSAA